MNEPCKSQTKLKFLPGIPAKDLQAKLNKLVREGYDPEVIPEKEALEEYQEPTYTITATKEVCICDPKVPELEAKVDELANSNEQLETRIKQALRNFGALKRAINEIEEL